MTRWGKGRLIEPPSCVYLKVDDSHGRNVAGGGDQEDARLQEHALAVLHNQLCDNLHYFCKFVRNNNSWGICDCCYKTKTFILCKGHHLHYCKYNANSYTCLLFCMHNCKLFALLLSMKIMQIQNYTNIFKRSDNNYYISFFYSTRFSLTQGSSSRSSCIVHPDLEPQLRSSINSLNVRGRG